MSKTPTSAEKLQALQGRIALIETLFIHLIATQANDPKEAFTSFKQHLINNPSATTHPTYWQLAVNEFFQNLPKEHRPT